MKKLAEIITIELWRLFNESKYELYLKGISKFLTHEDAYDIAQKYG